MRRCMFMCWGSFSVSTYRFASPEKELISRQGEVAGFPALNELPANLFLFQLPLDQRLSLLVYDYR